MLVWVFFCVCGGGASLSTPPWAATLTCLLRIWHLGRACLFWRVGFLSWQMRARMDFPVFLPYVKLGTRHFVVSPIYRGILSIGKFTLLP